MRNAARFALISAMLASTIPATLTSAMAQKLAPPSHLAFVLFEFDVRDQAGLPKVAGEIRDSAKHFKGVFVMREKVASLFGSQPSNLSVISFPSVDDAKSWLSSSEYAGLKPARDKVVDVRTYLVEKLD